jgi:hypothetical protein
MSDLPELQARELHDELRRIYTKSRRANVFAIYGRGQEETIRVENAGEFKVVPVRSELDLRERMPAFEETDPRIVFLVPWQGEVPLDLSSRFENRRVRSIDVNRRLLSLCGALEFDDNSARSPLARYLLRPKNPNKRYPISAGRITQEALWAAWLSTDWGFSDGLARDTLLAWAGTDARGARFLEAMDPALEPSAVGVRAALLEYLNSALGPAGAVIWRAWEKGRGREILEVALFCETLATSQDPAVTVWLGERLKPLLLPAEIQSRADIARALGEAAPLTFRLLEGKLSGSELAGVLKSADALVDDEPYIRGALIESDRLPCAWVLRLEQLGQALLRGAAAPTLEVVAEAAGCLKQLESHALFQQEGQTRAVKRAEMALRLLSWLAARPDQRLEVGEQDYADAVVLGRWYTEEGGFVDWARRWARGSAGGALGAGAQAVAELADRERAELDVRFTRALQRWVAAGRPSNEIVPIDQALKRFGVAFLEQNPQRRLLVLLMDGMAWAQGVELLQSMGTRPHGWGPLAWHGMNRVGKGAYPVVLANLPTTTEVSRSAFFAGKEMPSGSTLNTQKDDERFRDNKALQPFCDAAAGPRLLLRGEGHTGDGSASAEALSLIGDTRRGVVGIVINAIDASLKGDSQQEQNWTVDSIRSLADLLDAAREGGRTVLLAADHGHVRTDNLRTLSAPGQAGARYRPWSGDGDPLQRGELKFSGSGVYTPKGAQGVVLLATEDLRYGAAAHAGEHGGATLAEVVAPCVLIGWDEPVPETLADKALKPRPAYVPDWWHFAARAAVEVPRTPRPPSVGKRRGKSVPDAQLGFPELSVEPTPPVAPLEAPLAAFAGCEMLKARAPKAAQRNEVVRAVQLLLSRGSALAAEVFAQHLNVLPFRVEGYVRGLQEVLNVDGYAVLRFDSKTRQVFLEKSKLEQQFEVKL